MKFGDLKKTASRAGAIVGIATNLATMPITKDGTPNLTRQHAKYSKEVKLPNIRREITRNTTKTFTPDKVLDKRTAKRLRNP